MKIDYRIKNVNPGTGKYFHKRMEHDTEQTPQTNTMDILI
jgi:hypothetical protein